MTADVVITGLGIASPIGCSEERFWESLCVGRSGASPVDCLDTRELSRKIGCQIREPIESLGGMGRASALAVHAARQAMLNAGFADPPRPVELEAAEEDRRWSVIIGTTMGETDFIEERLAAPAAQWLAADQRQRILDNRPGVISRNVQRALRLQGTAMDLYGACAAGNMAVAAACRELNAGRCDAVLAGGSDGFSRLAFIGFMRARVMAADVCRPFDEARDGMWVGEGAGVFVLERESDARARGARIRARVVGCASTCETNHPTRPDPEGEGLTRAVRQALQDARLQPSDVDYVCAHGTGTPQNDAIEIKMMRTCFPRGIPFSSIKALTGHLMGAAAAAEVVACVLCLERQTLIPTWRLERPIPCEPLIPLMDRAAPGNLRCAVNNSAGFGGYNSSIILARVASA